MPENNTTYGVVSVLHWAAEECCQQWVNVGFVKSWNSCRFTAQTVKLNLNVCLTGGRLQEHGCIWDVELASCRQPQGLCHRLCCHLRELTVLMDEAWGSGLYICNKQNAKQVCLSLWSTEVKSWCSFCFNQHYQTHKRWHVNSWHMLSINLNRKRNILWCCLYIILRYYSNTSYSHLFCYDRWLKCDQRSVFSLYTGQKIRHGKFRKCKTINIIFSNKKSQSCLWRLTFKLEFFSYSQYCTRVQLTFTLN